MKTELIDLRESNEFLNILLDNFNSAVLIADENLKIFQVNNFFCHLFGDNDVISLHSTFGNVAGCANAVLEKKPCGETSKCDQCIIRRCLVRSLLEKVPVDKEWLEKSFIINGKLEKKYLEFSTRPITFQGRNMILVIIYDVTEIEEKKRELEKKQRQIDQDLAAAAEIQKSLLPKTTLHTDRLKMAWKFEPSEKIGGDIFNLCSADDKNLCMYMLDVCGHGVPAALIAVAVSQFLFSRRNLPEMLQDMCSPEKTLNHLNQAFPFERFESYFSIIYMVINRAEGRLIYGNAGHPPPILLGRNGNTRILDAHGPVIGVTSDHVFQQETIDLIQGDRVILYTDGLLDVTNSNEEFFGRHRLMAFLEKFRHDSLPDLTDNILREAKHFGGEKRPDDDITLLALEYLQ
jgi:sigma-B regulation protein RsbU (phosphoserine phosphatase)